MRRSRLAVVENVRRSLCSSWKSARPRPVRTTLPLTSIVALRQHGSRQDPLGLGLDSLPGRVHLAPQLIDEPVAVALLSSKDRVGHHDHRAGDAQRQNVI